MPTCKLLRASCAQLELSGAPTTPATSKPSDRWKKNLKQPKPNYTKHIKNGRDHNIAAKEAIVADAKALLELEDIEVQTTQAKELQSSLENYWQHT